MKRWMCGALVGASVSMACGAETQPRTVDAPEGERAGGVDETARAVAISDAYKKGNAKAWRHAITAQLVAAESMTRDELASATAKYVAVAAQRGVQGLEPVLAASLASLGHRDAAGWAAAQDLLVDLDEVWWMDAKVKPRPQARAAIKTLGSPVVHHVPLSIVQGLLAAQIDTGVLDLDGVMTGEDMCSPEAMAAFEARWGQEYADLLAAACNQGFSGPAAGGSGIGAIGGMSELDCLFDHEPTRAERVEQLMQDCAQSQGGGGGNPLADMSPLGSTFGWVFPLRHEAYTTETHGNDMKVESQTHYDNNDVPIYTDHYQEDGSVERNYYNDAGELAIEVTYDEDGNMTHGEAYEGSKMTESVDMHEDGSYTVKQYDEMGNVTSEETYGDDDEPQDGMHDPGMDGWGDTAECRALTLALIEDRLEGALEGDGIVDPRTVNPNPEGGGDVEDAGALDCFELTGGAQVDSSFGCIDPWAHCVGPGLYLASDCSCKSAALGVKPQARCGFFMMCLDGAPQEKDGQCSCPGDDFVDDAAGGGPRPQPVDRIGLPGPD